MAEPTDRTRRARRRDDAPGASTLPSRRVVMVGGLAALGSAALAACGASTGSAAAPAAPGAAGTEPSAPPSPPTTAPVPTYPLSGLPVDDPARAARVALVVKIDNVNDTSRPQAGINAADIVYEEKIEGPISRFAAVYHSRDAEDLGPVRSGRSTDIAIVSTLNTPLYAFSGANDVFIKKLRSAPLVDIGMDTPGMIKAYDRRKGRVAPDNVFTSTDRLRALHPEGGEAPVPQLAYRVAGQPLVADAVPVRTLAYSWGGGPVGQPVTFSWDAALGGWTRTQKGTPHVDADGVPLQPKNVVVQFVPYIDTGLVDLSKTPVPEADLVGSGTGWVFTDGHGIPMRWAKPDVAAVTRYTTEGGTEIAMTPGQTWIALVPEGGEFSGTRADGSSL